MGNLPFAGHCTMYYRPEDYYTSPFTLTANPCIALSEVCLIRLKSILSVMWGVIEWSTFVERLQRKTDIRSFSY